MWRSGRGCRFGRFATTRRFGLVEPSGRRGGFRLFTDADIERLLLVKAVRPLRLSLDETREMLAARDRMLAEGQGTAEDVSRGASYLAFAERRLVQARFDLEAAKEAIRLLRRDLSRRGVMRT
jgi:DNA-binding transcriptional MerR regulator